MDLDLYRVTYEITDTRELFQVPATATIEVLAAGDEDALSRAQAGLDAVAHLAHPCPFIYGAVRAQRSDDDGDNPVTFAQAEANLDAAVAAMSPAIEQLPHLSEAAGEHDDHNLRVVTFGLAQSCSYSAEGNYAIQDGTADYGDADGPAALWCGSCGEYFQIPADFDWA